MNSKTFQQKVRVFMALNKVTKTDMAKAMGVNAHHLGKVLNEQRRLTRDMAQAMVKYIKNYEKVEV